MNLTESLRLYLVADPDHVHGDFISMVEAALRGGVTTLQLRCKNRTDREFLAFAKSLREITTSVGVLFLVNDRLDIALASGADGIHVGVDDLPLADIRRLAPHLVVGYSPELDGQVQTAASGGASYLGVGPVFGTATKDDAGEAIGLSTLSHRARLAEIPVIGIGGITPSNAKSVLEAGAVGVAVVSAVTKQNDPQRAARQLREALT